MNKLSLESKLKFLNWYVSQNEVYIPNILHVLHIFHSACVKVTFICVKHHHVNRTYVYKLEHRFNKGKLICSTCAELARWQKCRRKGLVHFIHWYHNQSRFVLLNPKELKHYHGNTTRVHCMCTRCGYGAHGEWFPKINYLLDKRRIGCPLCGGTLKLTLKQAHSRVNKIFSGRISFYCLEHNGLIHGIKTKIIAHCSRCGTTWQTTLVHLLRGYGCGVCSKSNGEFSVIQYLKRNAFHMIGSKHELYKSNDLAFKHSYRVIYNNHNLSLDFMLNIHHHLIAIEYDGIQHFKPVDFSHKLRFYLKHHAPHMIIRKRQHKILVAWERQIVKDLWKTNWCTEHHIHLIRIKCKRRYSDRKQINHLVSHTLDTKLVPFINRFA